MKRETTSVTMTTTRNFVSSTTIQSRAANTESRTAGHVQMKWCQLKLNGEKVGKPFKMPLTCDDYDLHFDRIIKSYPRSHNFPENPKVEVDEWLVKHRKTPINYHEVIRLVSI